jgi:putative ABC transport system permease protein
MESMSINRDESAASLPAKRVGHAGFVDYAVVAVDSLNGNKLRSFLTLLGIIIGITSIICVICVIQGLDRYWQDKVSNFGPNSFVLVQYGIETNPDKFAEMQRRNTEIHADDAEAIRRACSACEEIGVETHTSLTVKYEGQTLDDTDVSGITPSIIDIEPYDIEIGRNIMDWENDHAQSVAFVGSDLREKLFGSVDPIGKSLEVGDHWFRIVGVAVKRGSVFGISRDNFVKVPLTTFQKIYGSRDSVEITIKAKPNRMEDALDQARLVMRTRHHLNYHDDDNFGFLTSEGVNNLFNSLTRVIFSVFLFVVGISLVVGGIVIMNIMLVSVVERTREIGIRKAVGARQQDVVNQFLVESVLLCSSGGIIGVTLAYCLSWTIGRFTPLPSAFPFWAPIVAVGLSSLIGVFFGIYPARRAGKLDPIEALRSE